jgi:hypothetical protein
MAGPASPAGRRPSERPAAGARGLGVIVTSGPGLPSTAAAEPHASADFRVCLVSYVQNRSDASLSAIIRVRVRRGRDSDSAPAARAKFRQARGPRLFPGPRGQPSAGPGPHYAAQCHGDCHLKSLRPTHYAGLGGLARAGAGGARPVDHHQCARLRRRPGQTPGPAELARSGPRFRARAPGRSRPQSLSFPNLPVSPSHGPLTCQA